MRWTLPGIPGLDIYPISEGLLSDLYVTFPLGDDFLFTLFSNPLLFTFRFFSFL